MDSDHFWFDPHTNNRDSEKLETMVKTMLEYTQNVFSQLTEELQRYGLTYTDRFVSDLWGIISLGDV